MRRAMLISAAISVLILGACQKANKAPAAEPTESVTAPENAIVETMDVAAWAGKWTGPEGLYVNITPGDNGKIMLEMQSDLDTKGSYEGTTTAEGIAFKRGEETLTLRQATGDETGLKYLAGKIDCLMVKSGEGYCRD